MLRWVFSLDNPLPPIQKTLVVFPGPWAIAVKNPDRFTQHLDRVNDP